MSTTSSVTMSGRRWGLFAALCAALLAAPVHSGAERARESADPDTSRKVVTSISISADGIVIEGKGDEGGKDTLGIVRIERDAAEADEKAIEQLERLEDFRGINIDTEGHDIVRFGEDIHIRGDKRIRGSVVAIGGSVIVEGHVVGDVVAVGGDLRMESGSSVTGDAVSVGGSLELEAGSSIRGDGVSVGGKIIEHEGSYVAGDTISVGFIPSFCFKGLCSPFTFKAMDITGYVVKMLVVLLLAWAVAALFPERLKVMVNHAGSSVWLSALVGFAAVIALPIVLILLIVTLIGIPLAIILPIAFVLASVVAYATGAGLLGYRLGSRLVSKAPGQLSLAQAVLLGVLIIGAVRLIGKLLALSGDVMWPLSAALGAIGVLAGVFIYLAGLGSLLLTRFGKRQPAAAGGVPVTPPL